MVATDKTYIDNSAPACNADDLNGFNLENKNLITGSGQTPLDTDRDQTGKAIAVYASKGDFYQEAGGSAADVYVLENSDAQEQVFQLKDGMRIRFRVVNSNTGASIVDINSIGAKAIELDGAALTLGALVAGSIAAIEYIESSGKFDLKEVAGDVLTQFKTNFSIDQKEDTEDTEFDAQQMFQMIPFETKFDSVTQANTFLHNVDTILVPADSHEITYTGTWVNDDSANTKFGRAIDSSTTDDTAILDFTGVSISLGAVTSTNRGDFFVELSSDGGSTYGNKKHFTMDETTTSTFNVIFDLYNGLEYGDYRIRLTIGPVGAVVAIAYFSYTAYMNQRPITQYALTSGGATDIDDVPPTTTLLTGTWGAKNITSASEWNNTEHNATVAGDYAEFKFYGSACWVSLRRAANTNCTLTPLIDGSSTKVKVTTFNVWQPSNENPHWVRLDDGTLSEGEHTIKLTLTTIIDAGDDMYIDGWGYYSADTTTDTTVKRSLICGKDSYIVGIDDPGFAFTGTWTGAADAAADILRRAQHTATNADFATFTTPNNVNLKAIYIVGATATDRGEVLLNLGGVGTLSRYIDWDANNYGQGCLIQLAYDSQIDGALHNKELRITKNGGTNLFFSGIIFEIGDPVSDDSIFCMPKWTRYNASININTCVSTSHRLDVFGSKTDTNPGRRPIVHSGWFFAASANAYWRHGLGISPNDIGSMILYKADQPSRTSSFDYGALETVGEQVIGDPGLLKKLNLSTATDWWKITLSTNRVI